MGDKWRMDNASPSVPHPPGDVAVIVPLLISLNQVILDDVTEGNRAMNGHGKSPITLCSYQWPDHTLLLYSVFQVFYYTVLKRKRGNQPIS